MKHLGRRTDAKDVATQEQLGLRNRVINGDFSVWQRGTSFSGASNVYTADRWMAAGATGQSITRHADHPFAGSGGYCIQVVNTASSQWIYQKIEAANTRDLVGQTVTLSCWVKVVSLGGSGARIDLQHATALDNFAGTTDIGTSSFTTSASWVRLSVTVVIPAGGANGLQVRVITAGGAGGAATVRVSGVQLEVGAASTPAEVRPYGLELTLCQRYFFQVNAADANHIFGPALCISGTQAFVPVAFPVTMRAIPSTLTHTGVAANYAIASVACNAAPTLSDLTSEHVGMTVFAIASGIASAQAYWGRANASGAYLGFSAEL